MFRKTTKLVSQTLNSIDIFDEPVKFNLQGERNISSSIGGLISLFVIIFLGVQSIIQAVAMFNRDGPAIIQMYEYQNNPEILYLNKSNNFMFAVSFTNNNAPMNLSVDSLFSFTSTFSQYVRAADGTQIKYKPLINWVSCTESDFSSGVFHDGTFNSYSLQYAYCPSTVNYTDSKTGVCPSFIKEQYPSCITPIDFRIRGNFLSENFDFISFRLTECAQADALHIEGLHCKSGNIKSQFTGNELQMNLYYANNLIDLTNHKAPNQTYLDTLYWNVNPSVSRVADIFIDSETMIDIDSYFSADASHNSTYFSIQSDKVRELQQFSTNYMLQWNFRRSNVNHVTTRTYTKILDVISNIGGIGGILMAVGFIATASYTKFKYKMILSNRLYDYESMPKLQKKSQKNNKIKPQPKSKLPTKFEGNENDITSARGGEKSDMLSALTTSRLQRGATSTRSIKSYFENLFEIKRVIPYSEFSYIKSLFCTAFRKDDTEQQLAEKGRKQAFKDLDIMKIIEKLQEIDKLKMLLLNGYQREAFEHIERPIITLKEEKPMQRRGSKQEINKVQEKNTAIANFEEQEEDESLPKYAKLYASYRCLINDTESQNSKYNKKLLEMLGEDLVKVFKHIDRHMGEDMDPEKFEEIVNKILNEGQNEFDLSVIFNITKL